MTTHCVVYTEPPPKPEDLPLRIYSNPICPFAQRVRLIVAAKKIPNEEINIFLKDQKPEWFMSKINPFGAVPVIEHEGHYIRESLIAFDYVDEAFEGASLWPSDPFKKATDRLIVDEMSKQFIPNYYKFYYNTADKSSTNALKTFIQKLEIIIKSHPGGFVGGKDSPAAVDYLIWPWFERLDAIKILAPELALEIPKTEFPSFYGWIESMKSTDAVKQSYIPPEAHAAFIKSFKENGTPDYSHVGTTAQGVPITFYAKQN